MEGLKDGTNSKISLRCVVYEKKKKEVKHFCKTKSTQTSMHMQNIWFIINYMYMY